MEAAGPGEDAGCDYAADLALSVSADNGNDLPLSHHLSPNGSISRHCCTCCMVPHWYRGWRSGKYTEDWIHFRTTPSTHRAVVPQTYEQLSSGSMYVILQEGHCLLSLAQGTEAQKFAVLTVGFCKTRGHQEVKPHISFGLQVDVLEDRQRLHSIRREIESSMKAPV